MMSRMRCKNKFYDTDYRESEILIITRHVNYAYIFSRKFRRVSLASNDFRIKSLGDQTRTGYLREVEGDSGRQEQVPCISLIDLDAWKNRGDGSIFHLESQRRTVSRSS